MAAAVSPSQTNSTDTSAKTDPPPKSYREAVSASKSEANNVTSKSDATQDTEDTKTKSAAQPPKVDKNGQENQSAEKEKDKSTEKEKDKSAEKAGSVTVKKFDNKLYVEAPPPKTNPWKKKNNPPSLPSQPKQLPTDAVRGILTFTVPVIWQLGAILCFSLLRHRYNGMDRLEVGWRVCNFGDDGSAWRARVLTRASVLRHSPLFSPVATVFGWRLRRCTFDTTYHIAVCIETLHPSHHTCPRAEWKVLTQTLLHKSTSLDENWPALSEVTELMKLQQTQNSKKPGVKSSQSTGKAPVSQETSQQQQQSTEVNASQPPAPDRNGFPWISIRPKVVEVSAAGVQVVGIHLRHTAEIPVEPVTIVMISWKRRILGLIQRIGVMIWCHPPVLVEKAQVVAASTTSVVVCGEVVAVEDEAVEVVASMDSQFGGFDDSNLFFADRQLYQALGTIYFNPVGETRNFVKKQIEYYFSPENLEKDIFLRKRMDKQGWIPIVLVAGFPRVKSLTSDMSIIFDALKDSEEVELSGDFMSIRKRKDPELWPLEPSPGEKVLRYTLHADVPEFVPGQKYPMFGAGNTNANNTSSDAASSQDDHQEMRRQTSEDVDRMDLSSYVTPVLSSSAPELIGEWHEVRRRERKAAKEREEREKAAKEAKEERGEKADKELEELDFMFDEELEQLEVGRRNNFTDWSDESDDDFDDSDIDKILIVTQTPPYLRKHPGGDRTGDHQPRAKISAELYKVINDGLMYYEQDLWKDDMQPMEPLPDHKTVNMITKEMYEKITPSSSHLKAKKVPTPPPTQADIARSLPARVPETPGRQVPRTPRTPHGKDTPRFYPVMKDASRPTDPQ
ncbi:hypothetical protein BaRGS_00012187, partial [Batillaria attramentaria]